MIPILTPKKAGIALIILGILWLIIAIGATVSYGSAMNLDLKSGAILYGVGPVLIIIGFLLRKFGKR